MTTTNIINDTRTRVDEDLPANSIMMACNVLAGGNKAINLIVRLKAVAKDGLREANKGNPFIDIRDAFKTWNDIKKLDRVIAAG